MWRLLPVFLLLAAGPAAADTMRCASGRLVYEGDTQEQVRTKCGEPTKIDKRTIKRRPLVWIRGKPIYVGEEQIEVTVELWLYNLGPQQLMRRLRFDNNRVIEIETLEHGYIEKPAEKSAEKKPATTP